MAANKKSLTLVEEKQPEYEEGIDESYDDAPDADREAGTDPEYGDSFNDGDGDDGGSQEWHHRPQK